MRALPSHYALLAALLGVGLGACTSRTLPLPPPTIEELSAPDAEGMVVLRGLSLEGAAVGVLNVATNEGVIVTSDAMDCESCPFEATLAAEVDDDIFVWQFRETESFHHRSVPPPAAP